MSGRSIKVPDYYTLQRPARSKIAQSEVSKVVNTNTAKYIVKIVAIECNSVQTLHATSSADRLTKYVLSGC